MPNGYFKKNSDGTIDVVATEGEFVNVTASGTITGAVTGAVAGDLTGDVLAVDTAIVVNSGATQAASVVTAGSLVGALTGASAGVHTGIRMASPQTVYTADDAIAITDSHAILDSNGATTNMTLEAGALGQRLSITQGRYSNASDVDADFGATMPTTITFYAPGQSLDLCWDEEMGGAQRGWRIIGSNGFSTADLLLDIGGSGAGLIGTSSFGAPGIKRWLDNGTIITEYKFDITGLYVFGTAANEVIGLAAGGAAPLGQYTIANSGLIYRTELSCIESSAGGATTEPDIDIGTNASGTLAITGGGSGAGDVGANKAINGGTLVVGQTVVNNVPAVVADEYFYLCIGSTAGDTSTYTAGQYIFRTYGHALLA